jgi:hypothetical protein
MPISDYKERFETIVRTTPEQVEEWVWPTPHKHYPCMPTHCLPPLGIDEPVVRADQMKLVTAGDSDVSQQTGAKAFSPDIDRGGFTRHQMKNTDETYTGEHAEQFYGDSGGFAERNNYLDRL